MAHDQISLLKNMPIFGAVSEQAIALILKRSARVQVKALDFFFRQDEDGRSTFVLESGRVEIVRVCNGDTYRLRELSVGDCFGEMALIDFGPRSASVRALVDSTAIEISPGCLNEVAALDLEQYALIYMNMARELSRRLRRSDDRLFRARVEAQIEDFEFSST